MTGSGSQLRDRRFRAGLEFRDGATRAGTKPDRLAYAEAMYGAPAWDGAEFDRGRDAVETAGPEPPPEDGGSTGMQTLKTKASFCDCLVATAQHKNSNPELYFFRSHQK